MQSGRACRATRVSRVVRVVRVAARMHGMRCAAWYAHAVRACRAVASCAPASASRHVRTPSPRASLA
ncbi:hypothetical protein WL15_09940 [Burkholderia multivorans]|nr:hypothetical protein WL15_09940 [Burkholderia multivorans]